MIIRWITVPVGEWRPKYPLVWRLALLSIALLAASSAPAASLASPLSFRGLSLCEPECHPVRIDQIRTSNSEILLQAEVIANPKAMPLAQSPAIRIIATASSEVRWNGIVIGRNGRPAANAAQEIPGNYAASITIPQSIVRPGRNLLSIRMSFHHLWLPVQNPVQAIGLETSGAAQFPGLGHYLPSLLMFGALAAALVYFGVAALVDRKNRSARILVLVASLTLIQLSIETLRVFLTYPYPWQLARVSVIALLSGAVSLLLLAYAAARFAPTFQKLAVSGASAIMAAGFLLIPEFDWKAVCAILAAAIAATICAVHGIRGKARGARTAILLTLATFGLILLRQSEFLDQAWFVLVAITLTLLVVEQLLDLKQAHHVARQLAGRLHQVEAADEFVILKEGPRTHRVNVRDIVHLKAADDYCEVRLATGRIILVSDSLSGLLEVLPAQFMRIHRSHAIHKDHIASVLRSGKGTTVQLADGSRLPVSRSYTPSLEGWLAGPRTSSNSALPGQRQSLLN